MLKNDRLIQSFKQMTPHYEALVNRELQKFWGWNYWSFIDQLIDTTPIFDHDAVLDVATGTACIPRRLIEQNRLVGSIVGLDITLEMLKSAKKQILAKGASQSIKLACADAMVMPFRRNSFDVVICGLATHHIEVPTLLSEMRRVLKPGGSLTIADVGGSSLWQLPAIRSLLKISTFFYFMLTEGASRAWAEASALPNVKTAAQWQSYLEEIRFTNIHVSELPKTHTWIPSPLLITAIKPT